MPVAVLAMLLVVSALSASAGPQNAKAPWEWTIEERLSARLAPKSPAFRTAANDSAVRRAGDRYFEIDGKVHPELFLPWELFNTLIRRLSDERELAAARTTFDDAISKAGWEPDAFWKTLAELSAPYLAAQADRLALKQRLASLPPPDRRLAEAEIETLEREQCRARAKALIAARAHFGPSFERFLYASVAPTISVGSQVPPAGEAERLRAIEGGCE